MRTLSGPSGTPHKFCGALGHPSDDGRSIARAGNRAFKGLIRKIASDLLGRVLTDEEAGALIHAIKEAASLSPDVTFFIDAQTGMLFLENDAEAGSSSLGSSRTFSPEAGA